MKKTYIIAPSILSADFARLGASIDRVIAAGADWVHFDVMDNHYVPNLTMGPLVCKALREYGIQAPIDVHLMVRPVDKLIKDFIEAGATSITFHPEATDHIDRSLGLIREGGCQAGLVFNPATTLDHLTYVAERLDMILLMSVNPGFGGQSFLPSVLPKIRAARDWIDRQNEAIRLQVDGGINNQTLALAAQAGADAFVAGSAIFGHDHMETAINDMRAILQKI